MDSLSFKERVVKIAIEQAISYKNVFVDYEYLFCSEAFINQDYYIISAKPDNYRHLIGVNTIVSADDFFKKCINGELKEDDFDFFKNGRSEKEIKGSVRRKIKSLPHLTSIIGKNLIVQENYNKNGILCSFATTDCEITVGFINEGKSRPKTLLWGDSLDWDKSAFVDLVLRRKIGEKLFSDIVVGDVELVQKYQDKIKDVISDDLLNILKGELVV